MRLSGTMVLSCSSGVERTPHDREIMGSNYARYGAYFSFSYLSHVSMSMSHMHGDVSSLIIDTKMYTCIETMVEISDKLDMPFVVGFRDFVDKSPNH